MSKTPNKDELRDIMAKLMSLTDPENYEPGLMVWQEMFASQMERLKKFLER